MKGKSLMREQPYNQVKQDKIFDEFILYLTKITLILVGIVLFFIIIGFLIM